MAFQQVVFVAFTIRSFICIRFLNPLLNVSITNVPLFEQI